ncbi:MAG: rhomboid family intramembrane serine protease, partial [Stackebrandtia sp.]
MSEDSSAPVCYRHPQKETYVQCVRCERYICPDCMNQASVGWQCPECVKAGQKTIRQARTALGGVGGHNGLVTKTLIGINVAVFLAGLVLVGTNALGDIFQGGLFGGQTPLHIYGALTPGPIQWQSGGESVITGGVMGGEYYRFLTSMFLHYGIVHLLFNMYVLWVVGRHLERDLGPVRYLALYLLSGLGGNVLTYLVEAPNTASAGASGCIFGLFGAMVLINRKLGRDNSGIYVVVGLNLVLTFTIPGISWTGHLGGLITGAALGAALAHAPRQNRTLIQTGAFAAALVVFVLLILWRT